MGEIVFGFETAIFFDLRRDLTVFERSAFRAEDFLREEDFWRLKDFLRRGNSFLNKDAILRKMGMEKGELKRNFVGDIGNDG